MAITINNVIIHELIKEQHKPIQQTKYRENVLNNHHKAVIKLINEIISLYGRRNHAAHYGTFREREGRGLFPNKFEEYAQKGGVNEADFIELSKVAMESLYSKAEGMSAASGGYMFYADYNSDQTRYFLIAMIKQKEGITLSARLEPEELTQLDLNRLHQAAKINFSKLSSFKKASGKEKQELNYLSFVSPNSTKTTAGYFVTALGCAQGTAPSRATDSLIRESVNFFRNHEDLKCNYRNFKDDLLEFLNQKIEKDESVKLSEIERLARKYIPADDTEKADEVADDFLSHLNSEEVAVPVEFPVTKRALNKYQKISYESENWEINFQRSALGETANAQIYYNKKQKSLTLNEIPDEMIKTIEKELDEQKAG